jgi:hypothetical protein
MDTSDEALPTSGADLPAQDMDTPGDEEGGREEPLEEEPETVEVSSPRAIQPEPPAHPDRPRWIKPTGMQLLGLMTQQEEGGEDLIYSPHHDSHDVPSYMTPLGNEDSDKRLLRPCSISEDEGGRLFNPNWDPKATPVYIIMCEGQGETQIEIYSANLRAAAAGATALEREELPPEPLTLEEALQGPHALQWREAMDREWRTLQERGTWVLEELPEGRRPVGVKWVFKIKSKPDGSLDKFKARMVAKGYSQVRGVDFLDTYAPVSRFTTLRVLLALAVHRHMGLAVCR